MSDGTPKPVTDSADGRDAILIGLGIAEVTHIIATTLVQQGALSPEAYANTVGASFRSIDRDAGVIELILFGKEDYKDNAIKLVE